ncbi:conserved protein of unknown function [Streptococcus thermophilus]|nr:conserved protein of unknown function [Streptococcus thermophilus]
MARSDRHFSVSESMITFLKGKTQSFLTLKLFVAFHFNVF